MSKDAITATYLFDELIKFHADEISEEEYEEAVKRANAFVQELIKKARKNGAENKNLGH